MSSIPPALPRRSSLAVGVWTGLGLLAALLWSRQFAGNFPGPMPVGWVAVWTTFVTAASAVAWWWHQSEQPSPWSAAVAVGLAFVTSLAGAPGLSAAGLGVYVGLWITAGVVFAAWRFGESPWDALSDPEPVVPPAPAADGVMAAIAPMEEPIAEELDDDGALQTMSRRLTDDGEVIEGSVRVELPTGERDATVHVSFCPPLAATPQVETEDLDGHGWEIKVAAAYPFGLRLQIRRGRDCVAVVTGRIAYWAAATTSARAA